MHMIMAVIKPNKIEAVKAALVKLGILGMTAVESKGFARQLGHNERYRGPKIDAGFVPKVSVLVCVNDLDKSKAVNAIIESARTGQVGDGKIFVWPVPEVIRIRTGDRDESAI
jgi:nitrogen regulatory protein PII